MAKKDDEDRLRRFEWHPGDISFLPPDEAAKYPSKGTVGIEMPQQKFDHDPLEDLDKE